MPLTYLCFVFLTITVILFLVTAESPLCKTDSPVMEGNTYPLHTPCAFLQNSFQREKTLLSLSCHQFIESIV